MDLERWHGPQARGYKAAALLPDCQSALQEVYATRKNDSASALPPCIIRPLNPRRILFAALPSVFAVLIFVFGVAAGRYQTARVIRRQILDYKQSETLGQIVPKGERAHYA